MLLVLLRCCMLVAVVINQKAKVYHQYKNHIVGQCSAAAIVRRFVFSLLFKRLHGFGVGFGGAPMHIQRVEATVEQVEKAIAIAGYVGV